MVYFFTNNLCTWTYQILNIQFLQSAFFYYISEDYVYKLFHSLCTEKLMFSIFSGIIMYWRNTENWETYKFFKFSLQTTCTHGLMNSYKILNIQFLLSAFFYYISEAYVYKLFHSLCTEKLMFLYFFWHYHVLEEHRKLRNIQIFQIFFTNNLYAWAYEFL